MRKLNHFLILIITGFSPLLYANNDLGTLVVEPIMTTLPAGEFLMGSKVTDAEQPVHKVKVRAFQLAKYEVTIKEFLQFTKATGYKATGDCQAKASKDAFDINAEWGFRIEFDGEFTPINCVSWKDAQAYISWLNQQTGKHYRLPTEAEWEYAARAGSNAQFHFGDDEKQLCNYENGYDTVSFLNTGRDAHWNDQPIACDDGESMPGTVGVYQPNGYGLYDMLGNVSEWVADCYRPDYKNASKTNSAQSDENCTAHFARGGSWATDAKTLRTSFRPTQNALESVTAERFYDRGFRLALDTADKTESTHAQQKNFITALTKAQKTALERSTFATKTRAELLRKYQSWPQTPTIIPPMVTIPAGEFLMGSDLSNNEKPVHKVNIKAFKISKYEVTVKQFKQFAAATGYITGESCWKFFNEGGGRFKTGYDMADGNWLTPEYAPSDYHPVMCVSWDDANAYLRWLSQQTGKEYRLPTEAEWEYAGRAGSTSKYFFGDDDKKLCHYANTFDKSGLRAFVRDKAYKQKEMVCDDGAEYTSIVGMYKPNAFGLYDMIGNISEWVEDCDHNNYEGAPDDGSAWLAEECAYRTRRGNSYGAGAPQISMRGHGGQSNRSSLGEGFRIAEDVCLTAECTKEDGRNAFEIELAEKQKIEHIKRNKEQQK